MLATTLRFAKVDVDRHAIYIIFYHKIVKFRLSDDAHGVSGGIQSARQRDERLNLPACAEDQEGDLHGYAAFRFVY